MNGNDIVKFMLRSPLHGLMSGSTMLVTVTGRKTGREITLPVNYVRQGDTLWVVSSRDRTWWRNLSTAAPVKLLLRGKTMEGIGEAVLDEAQVTSHLAEYVCHFPLAARSIGIHMANGQPDGEDLKRAARERLMVKISFRG